MCSSDLTLGVVDPASVELDEDDVTDIEAQILTDEDRVLAAALAQGEAGAAAALAALKHVVESVKQYQRGDEVVFTWTTEGSLLVTLPRGCAYTPPKLAPLPVNNNNGNNNAADGTASGQTVTVADWRNANRALAIEQRAGAAQSLPDVLEADPDADLLRLQYPAPSLAPRAPPPPPPAVAIHSPALARAAFETYLAPGAVSTSMRDRVAEGWRKLAIGRGGRGEPLQPSSPAVSKSARDSLRDGGANGDGSHDHESSTAAATPADTESGASDREQERRRMRAVARAWVLSGRGKAGDTAGFADEWNRVLQQEQQRRAQAEERQRALRAAEAEAKRKAAAAAYAAKANNSSIST